MPDDIEGLQEGGAVPQVVAHDNQTVARALGHDWPDIDQFQQRFVDAAQAEGHSEQDAYQYLGYPNPAAHFSQMAADTSDFAARGGDVNEIRPIQYAHALIAGAARDPQDFAQKAGIEAKEVAGYPTFQDATDAALTVHQNMGQQPTTQSVANMRANLLDLWSKTGVTPQDAQHNPALEDHLALPYQPAKTFLGSVAHVWAAGGAGFSQGFGNPVADIENNKALMASAPIIPMAIGVVGAFKVWNALWGGAFGDIAKMVGQAEYEHTGSESAAEEEERQAFRAMDVLSVFAMAEGGTANPGPNAGAVVEGMHPLIGQVLRNTEGAGRNPFRAKWEAERQEPPPLNAAPLPKGFEGNIQPDQGRQLALPGLQNTTEVPPGWVGLSKQQLGAAEARIREASENGHMLDMEQKSMAEHGAPIENNYVAPLQQRIQWREESVRTGELFTQDEMGPRLPVSTEAPEYLPRDPAELISELVGKVRALSENEPEPAPADFDVKPFRVGIENALHQIQNNSTERRIGLYQAIDSLPADLKGTPESRVELSHEVEKRTVNPDYEHKPATRRILNMIEPLTDMQRTGAENLKRLLGRDAQGDLWLSSLRGVEEGYASRFVREDEPNPLDPAASRGLEDVITGRTGRKGVRASSIEHRAFYVFKNGAKRIWGDVPLTGLRERLGMPNLTFGDVIKDAEGNEWTIGDATAKEVEANTNVRYHLDYLSNLVLSIDRIYRAIDNARFLQRAAQILHERGLYYPEEFGHLAPNNYVQTTAPFLRGRMHPDLANPINDFFDPQHHDVADALSRIAGAVVHSMFVSPVFHIANMGTNWAATGGMWSFTHPLRLIGTSVQAWNEVMHMGPLYREILKRNGSLFYADRQMRDFHKFLLQSLIHDQELELTQNARGVWEAGPKRGIWSALSDHYGFTSVKNLIHAEMEMSDRILWAAGDMFMVQRVLELQKQGYSLDRSIDLAKLHIPSYRMPSKLIGSRLLPKILKSPIAFFFGPYHYSNAKLIGTMTRDLFGPATQPSAAAEFLNNAREEPELTETHESRGRAAAFALATAAMATIVYPALNQALQDITGNPNASWRYSGALSPIVNGIALATGHSSWQKFVGSFLTLSPVWGLLATARSNTTPWGTPVVSQDAGFPAKFAELLEGISPTNYAAHQLVNLAMHPDRWEQVMGNMFLNANLGTPFEKEPYYPYAREREKEQERRRERNDNLAQFFNSLGSMAGF